VERAVNLGRTTCGVNATKVELRPRRVADDGTVEIAATAEGWSERGIHNSGVYRCEVEVFALANSKAIRRIM
jgi:hypothetical protein